MAARKNKIKLTDTWKDNIRTSMLMNRLHNCALGEVEMTATQIKAAQIVLAKVVPDLARTEHTGKDGGAIVVQGVAHDDNL